MLNIVNTADPTQTRQVNEGSWKLWPKAKGLDPREYRKGPGDTVWQLVDDEALAKAKEVRAARTLPIAPPEVTQMMAGAKEVRDPVGPDGMPIEQAEEKEAPRTPRKRRNS